MNRRHIRRSVCSNISTTGNAVAVVVGGAGHNEQHIKHFVARTNSAETAFIQTISKPQPDNKLRNSAPIQRARTFLRLLRGVKQWSQTRGAKQVLIHVTTGANLKATDRLLKRAGAKCIGGGYVV